MLTVASQLVVSTRQLIISTCRNTIAAGVSLDVIVQYSAATYITIQLEKFLVIPLNTENATLAGILLNLKLPLHQWHSLAQDR